MVYLVTNDLYLLSPENYKIISVSEALKILEPMKIVSADTETEGLDPYTKKLLSVQLGNQEDQIVIDCRTVDIHEFKDFLESDRLFIFWNACFDLKFLYHQRIIPKNIYDGYLAEQLLWLGYPAGTHEYSLKAAGINYLNIELDKSVRGQIITKGLTEQVVIYAANDVKYEEPIREKQLEQLKEKDLLKALDFENEFVKCLAYIEYCGLHLDKNKWKTKMKRDAEQLAICEKNLNDWVVNYFKANNGDINRKVIKGWFKYKSLDLNTFDITNYDIPDNCKVTQQTRVIENDNIKNWEVLIEYKFPFVYQELQGDLFSGFNNDYICDINWNSGQQVIPLFEFLGINVKTFDKKTKASKKSVDAKILEPQINDFEIVKLYLQYKEVQKIVSTYGDNWLKAINPVSGRIHIDFHQLGTATGRLSSGGGVYKLNAQNLPHDAETRACFTAMPGNKWISVDYQSQESRLIASIANDPAMLELFRTGCGDIHSLVAKMAYPDIIGDTPIEDIKHKFKNARQEAKGIEFAINKPPIFYFSLLQIFK